MLVPEGDADRMQTSNRRAILVRGFKWPRRPTAVATAWLLGEDAFGRWLGVTSGSSWWMADHSQSGVFNTSFVKLVPDGTFWTACFNLADPLVDVDIVQPVRWLDDVLEEVDLELDILRLADGSVRVRDQEAFDHVRAAWAMPADIAAQAETTCAQIRARYLAPGSSAAHNDPRPVRARLQRPVYRRSCGRTSSDRNSEWCPADARACCSHAQRDPCNAALGCRRWRAC